MRVISIAFVLQGGEALRSNYSVFLYWGLVDGKLSHELLLFVAKSSVTEPEQQGLSKTF